MAETASRGSVTGRRDAVEAALRHFDNGEFDRALARRVAWRTASQEPDSGPALRGYLAEELGPALVALGFSVDVHDNPTEGAGPLLVARRHEGADGPTILMYGHGDVIRGQDASWTRGAGPWQLKREGERMYGRGTADNKGQHSINLAALESVLRVRARQAGAPADLARAPLGFNITCLIETGEETGSPGLADFCRAHREELAADVLLASDGPRLSRERPTLFLGSRGVANFELSLALREGAHHSGNWGGLLRNPGVVLAHAIASLVDSRGSIRVQALRPPPIPANVRAALRGLEFGADPGDPPIDADWGEPGLTPAERVIAWNTLEVLAYRTGNPDHPVNAIPPSAKAAMHMRFVVGTDIGRLREHLRSHLDAHGFADVQVGPVEVMQATRLDPDNAWVRFVRSSIVRTTGREPVLLPNLGGSLPNDVFAELLGLPTVWIPHSYAGCSQHAPDEHLLVPVAREALSIMAALYWDIGESAASMPRRAAPSARPLDPPVAADPGA